MNAIADQGVRRGRKFDQVLEVARKIFMRDGFECASVDDIAREAGVEGDLPMRVALIIAADQIVAFQMTKFGQRRFRIVVG